MIKRKTLVAVALALAIAPIVARAAGDDVTRHPSYVDGSALLDLAGEEGEIVEVSIGPALLDSIRSGVRDDRDASSVLSGLRALYAYVVGLEHDPGREAAARREVKAIESKLVSSGWERIVRVRDKGDNVHVFTRPGGTIKEGQDRIVSGLVVLALDGEDSQVVFVNIVGDIDMAKLGALADTVDVPGLKDAAGDSK